MVENIIEKQPKIDPKTGFTDTGSAKISDFNVNPPENTNKPAEISENNSNITVSKGNPKENQPNPEENQPNPEENQPNLDKSNDIFSESNKDDFKKRFPNVNLTELQNSKNFQDFLTILTKNPTLSQVYACFNSISQQAEENSQKRMLQALANASVGVGSLSSQQASGDIYFTKEQVKSMSSEQIRQNFDKIRQSQAKW